MGVNRPIVALVGRVNTGKSTLMNALLGKPLALVGATPGLTRDGIRKVLRHEGMEFELVDTGGLFSPAEDPLAGMLREKIEAEVRAADLVVFLVDLKTGLTPFDEEIAAWLRKLGKPVLLVGNKGDIKRKDPQEFQRLGLGEPLVISAAHRQGLEDLKDAIVARLGKVGELSTPGTKKIRVAIFGRPNVGKSSLLNRMVGREVVLVSDVPGTTRDAVDVETDRFVFVDTAGILRRYHDDVSYWAAIRTEQTLHYAEVAIVLLDVTQGITRLDRKILGWIHDEGRPMVLTFSKADLLDKKAREAIFQKSREVIGFVDYAPLIFTSAKTGENVPYLARLVETVYREWTRRLDHEALVQFFEEWLQRYSPPAQIFRFAQVGRRPPTLLLEVEQELPTSVLRFLERALRHKFGLIGTPIRFVQRTRAELRRRRRTRRGRR